MNKKGIIGLIVTATIILVLGVGYISMSISYNNGYVRQINLLKSKQVDNKSEFDNVWKKIKQFAKVSEKERESLKDIFISHANARGGAGDNAVMTWIKESVPNVDSSLFKNLQNIIISSRDAWTMRQKELIDMKRVLDNKLQTFPGTWFLRGKETVEIQIITSTKTEKTFESGKDDDVEVF